MSRLPKEPTLRAALLAGFGLTLGLWLLMGYQTMRHLADAQGEAVALDARYVRAQEALSQVRSEVLLTSVIIRDALLDTAPRTAANDQKAIGDAYQAIDLALARYVPVFGSAEEVARVDRLKTEVAAFRKSSSEILATDSRTWQVEGRLLLRRFLPSRERAVTVSEETQSINRALYVEQRRATSDRQAALQTQMWQGLGIALALSLLVAWLSFGYATRLERRLRAQHAREAQISADLQRLSACLVDVQEEEQRRIARELHDEVGQGLSAVQLELTVAKKRLQRAGVTEEDVLEDACTATNAVLRSVRNLSQLLHPSVLEDLGLSVALESHVVALGRRTGIVVELIDTLPSTRPSAPVERTVYRVVQEALNNVVKHAKASRVVVRLEQQDDKLVAVIEDNGMGFDTRETAPTGRRSGLGLLGIRERVAQLGGTMHLRSSIGGGTRLEISLSTHVAATAITTDTHDVPDLMTPEATWLR